MDGTVTSRPAAPASPWHALEDIQNQAKVIAGPSALPINITSLSISTDAPTGNDIGVALYGYHVANSAMSCSTINFDDTLWLIHDVGDGATPLSFTFPTPLQYKPAANTKACVYAASGSGDVTTINAVGFYGG